MDHHGSVASHPWNSVRSSWSPFSPVSQEFPLSRPSRAIPQSSANKLILHSFPPGQGSQCSREGVDNGRKLTFSICIKVGVQQGFQTGTTNIQIWYVLDCKGSLSGDGSPGKFFLSDKISIGSPDFDIQPRSCILEFLVSLWEPQWECCPGMSQNMIHLTRKHPSRHTIGTIVAFVCRLMIMDWDPAPSRPRHYLSRNK